MKILVTGGCGYIGTTLIPKLLGAGHKVLSIDNQLFGNFLPKHKNLKNIKKFRLGSYKSIQSIIKKKTKTYIKKDLSNYYCLNSKNTSKKIASFFKNNC